MKDIGLRPVESMASVLVNKETHGIDPSPMVDIGLGPVYDIGLRPVDDIVKGHRDVSPPVTARIPKTYIPRVLLSSVEEAVKKSNDDEEDRPNIRASSIPRPRAVLSSPDNDAVIGSKNKVKAVQPFPLKHQKLTQNRHAQCKGITNNASDESSVNMRKAKTRAVKGTKMPVPAFSSHKR
ncbi:hypothetical protein Tsubulata_015803 [Turnera subulata]|uniref:Uncharacterized protein n=1 Tax=Turnera subulata TaxID=218843 RepID=A0A9Q0FAS2_9ROSI|nr:hypothetical protein Tsubulata_015803 [Turnera subulata]